MLRNDGSIDAKLIAYGKNMRKEIELFDSNGRYNGALEVVVPKFDAARAEFKGYSGTVVVWANVTGSNKRALEDGGENIGVSTSLNLFEGLVRPVVLHAIERTKDLRPESISALLDKVTETFVRSSKPGLAG